MRAKLIAAFSFLLLAGCGSAPSAGTPEPTRPIAGNVEGREARRQAIHDAAETIHAELANGGGDWHVWQQATAPRRSELAKRLPSGSDIVPAMAMEARDNFPLLEVFARGRLKHVYDPSTLDAFRRDRPVAAASRWFSQQGIDLIFVSVPVMSTVYVEHFVADCPSDGIIAPHMRQAILELLEDDVETVDCWKMLRAGRDKETLYLPADTHWGEPGIRVIAKEVTSRLRRYDFGAKAQSAESIVKVSAGRALENYEHGDGAMSMTPSQRERVAKLPAVAFDAVTDLDGGPVADDPRSPLLLMGNSYVGHFREELIRRANLRIRTRWRGGETTQNFGDFLREPDLLAGVRVAVWVVADQYLANLNTMPAPIMAVLSKGH